VNNCALEKPNSPLDVERNLFHINPITVNYTAFNGSNYVMREFVGRNTSVLITPDDLLVFTSEQACELVDQADYLYETFKELMGVEPVGSGPLRIAFVTTCGGGCGYVGAKGIELGPYFASGTAWFARGDIPDLYPYLVHEMTHNFDRWSTYVMYGSDISHAWTSFMDVYIVAANQQGQAPNSGGSPGYGPAAFLQKRIDDFFMPFYSTVGATWQTCVRDAGCTNINATSAQGGFAARLAQLVGVTATKKAMSELKNAVDTRGLNPATMTPEQKNDLLIECFSRGAQTNLSCVVASLHWTISPGLQSQLTALFGAGNSLCLDGDGDGYTPLQGDFNDSVSSIHPGAVEVVNGIDDDCDGIVDNVIIGESADFPNDLASALSVHFPCRIVGTNSSSFDDDFFTFSLPSASKVHFSIRSKGAFAGWLFVYDSGGGWLTYLYCGAGSQSDMDVSLPAGPWRISVSQNVASAPGGYEMSITEALPLWPSYVYPGKASQTASNHWQLLSPAAPASLTGGSNLQARFWASSFGWIGTNAMGLSNTTSFNWTTPSNLPPNDFTFRAQFYLSGIWAARPTEARPLSGIFPMRLSSQSNQNFSLSWSAASLGLVPFTSSSPVGSWLPVPNAPQFTNGQFWIATPQGNESLKLFRLQGN
jgi:hypothetical protein